MLERIREEVLKEYKNLPKNRGRQGGDRSVHQVGAGSDGEAVLSPTGADGGKGLDDDDHEEEPADHAARAFVANNLHKGTNRGGWTPFSRIRRSGRGRSPAGVTICRCPLGISSELTLRAASSATGETSPSNMITGQF